MVNGSTNYHVSVLKDHDESQMHKRADEFENKEHFEDQFKKTISKKVPENGPLKEAFRRMSAEERQKMSRLFEVAYYVRHNSRPYSDFPTLIELEKHHGVDLPTVSYAMKMHVKTFCTI